MTPQYGTAIADFSMLHAIEFAEWIQRDYAYWTVGKWYRHDHHHLNPTPTKTTKEIYQEYLKTFEDAT